MSASPEPIETDALVIGAGPVGLFQVFELGLLGIRTHVVDALPAPGGQCVALYAGKPIYDIPGTPVCSGRELIERLQAQVAPFAPTFHLNDVVSALALRSDGGFDVGSKRGMRWRARSVFIAAGVGAFQPRRLALDGLDAFDGIQVFQGAGGEAEAAGRRLVILGDGDSALDAAVGAARAARSGEPTAPASVTLMHRRDDFKAEPALQQAFGELRSAGAIDFVAAQATGIEIDADRLVGLQLLGADGRAARLALDVLWVRTGLSPRLGPIADWGLAMERKQLPVDTARFETSIAGIHAVGDINTYAGKRKLIVSGFHEATLAAYAAAERLAGGGPVALEYTTTSKRIHRALGVGEAPQA